MSVNVYFSEEIRNVEGFETKPYPNGAGDGMSVLGFSLHDQNGRLYSICSEDCRIPEILVPYVTEISAYVSMSAERTIRETGIYRHEGAQAEVELENQGNRPVYRIKAKGPKMEEVQELVRFIKTGTIRPTESYEGAQQGVSRIELERELNSLGDKLASLKADLRNLRRWVEHDVLFFCKRGTIAKKIDRILDLYNASIKQ